MPPSPVIQPKESEMVRTRYNLSIKEPNLNELESLSPSERFFRYKENARAVRESLNLLIDNKGMAEEIKVGQPNAFGILTISATEKGIEWLESANVPSILSIDKDIKISLKF